MAKLLFVGEKPSLSAQRRKWRWEDGRLAAVPLFDALTNAGIDPTACRFVNLFGQRESNPERPTVSALREIRSAVGDGWKIVALGRKVSRLLPIEHLQMRHPAARGAGRLRETYRAHVASVLTSSSPDAARQESVGRE